MEIVGLDLLTNPAITGADTINLDKFDLPEESSAPKLVQTFSEDAGPSETWNGLENLNAQESFIPKPSHSYHRMSDEHNQRKKYEMLRKFDRLAKMGYDENLPDDKVRLVENPKKFMGDYIEHVLKGKTKDNDIVDTTLVNALEEDINDIYSYMHRQSFFHFLMLESFDNVKLHLQAFLDVLNLSF